MEPQNVNLELRNLTKIYTVGSFFKKKDQQTQVKALDHVSLTLKPGMYGLLGPNGAGKSTLIGVITGNLQQTSGMVLWCGRSIRAQGIHYRRILGFMPQQQNLYDSFSGYRFLAYICTLKEIPAKKVCEEVERVAAEFNLLDQLSKHLSAYSGGMKQRLLAASAIIGEPKLVILDEPTAGLDPKERVRMRNYMKELSKSCILLIATHVVSDVEDVADEIIFLNRGKIVAQGSRDELLKKYREFSFGSRRPGNLEDIYLQIFGEE